MDIKSRIMVLHWSNYRVLYQYAGCDAIFLYRFVSRHRGHFPPPQPPPAVNFCSHDNLQTTFQISFIFDKFDGPDL